VNGSIVPIVLYNTNRLLRIGALASSHFVTFANVLHDFVNLV
jgi:hypothetical protein